MKNWKYMGLTVFGATTLIVMAVQALSMTSPSRKHFDWETTYDPNSKEPYGTWVMRKLLNDYTSEGDFTLSNEPLTSRLPHTGSRHSYLFIGDYPQLTDDDIDSLEQFVRRGNVAFFATENIPDDLLCRIYRLCEETPSVGFIKDDEVLVQLSIEDYPNEQSYSVPHFFENEKIEAWWEYIEYPESDWRFLGSINEAQPNFMELSLGDGFIYLHTTPLVFTNIVLLDQSMVNYDQKVLSYLREGDIYWDRAERVDFEGGGSAFAFVLAQPALRWAWYLLIAMAVIFVIFRSKRMQRVIPVIEANTNTSLEFVKTMGQLYRMQSDHKKVVEMQMNQFLAHARDHYRISTHDEAELALRIASKAQVSIDQINRIFAMNKALTTRADVTNDDLIEFHRLLQDFYSASK